MLATKDLIHEYKGELIMSALPMSSNTELSADLAEMRVVKMFQPSHTFKDNSLECIDLRSAVLARPMPNVQAATKRSVYHSYYSGFGSVQADTTTMGARWEKALSELSGLMPADDFIPPSTEIIHDLEALAEIISDPAPLRVAFPSIEHDGSTGLVSLSWFQPKTHATFSISLKGGKQVYAMYVNPVDNEFVPFKGKQIRSHDILPLWDDPRIAAVVTYGA